MQVGRLPCTCQNLLNLTPACCWSLAERNISCVSYAGWPEPCPIQQICDKHWNSLAEKNELTEKLDEQRPA